MTHNLKTRRPKTQKKAFSSRFIIFVHMPFFFKWISWIFACDHKFNCHLPPCEIFLLGFTGQGIAICPSVWWVLFFNWFLYRYHSFKPVSNRTSHHILIVFKPDWSIHLLIRTMHKCVPWKTCPVVNLLMPFFRDPVRRLLVFLVASF